MTRPAGFYEVRQDGHICWFRPDTLSLLSPRVFEPSHWQALDAVTGSAQGRGTAWFVHDGKQQLVLRHYHRGGLFGRLLKDLYVGLRPAHSRAMRELALLEEMHQAGLPVPLPAAARMSRVGPLHYRADILIGRITAAQDLLAVLRNGPLEASQWQQIGAMISRFHAAGIDHTDLNIHNILLDQRGKSWLIDFDKCRQRSKGRWQQDNLARLLRSLNKEKRLASTLHWDEQHWPALLAGYHSDH